MVLQPESAVDPRGRRRLGAAAALSAAAVVALTGVASCSTAVDVRTVVARSATQTVAQKTADLWEHLVITAGSGQTQDITSTGVGDFRSHRLDMTLSIGAQHGEVILDGTTIYEKLAALTSLTGKPWVKIDLNALGNAAGVNGLGDLLRGQSNDPTQGLQFLSGVTGPVTTVGHEAVRGVEATHYRVTSSLDAAAANLPAAEQASIRQIVALIGVHTTIVDVWIDGQGRVRRYHYAFDYRAAKPPAGVPAGALPKSMDITVELYNFGALAVVALPSATQTADLAKVLDGAPSAATTVPPSAATSTLEGLLLTTLPPGYHQADDSLGQTGPSDLAKAAGDDGGPNARQVLLFDQFVAGYQRLWTNGTSQIIEYLYEFATPKGAVAYGERQLADAATPPTGDQVTPFSVPTVPGAHGFTASGTDGPGDVVMFSRGRYLAQVVVAGPAATPKGVAALAALQYERLPSA